LLALPTSAQPLTKTIIEDLPSVFCKLSHHTIFNSLANLGMEIGTGEEIILHIFVIDGVNFGYLKLVLKVCSSLFKLG
jgi:hypothetical protein